MLIAKFVNVTGQYATADYRLEIYANQQLVHTELIKGHQRDKGWRGLLALAAKSSTPDSSIIEFLMARAKVPDHAPDTSPIQSKTPPPGHV